MKKIGQAGEKTKQNKQVEKGEKRRQVGKEWQKKGGTGGLEKREKSEVVERKEGNKKRKDGGRA